MKLIAKYLLLLILIQNAKSGCTQGCLVCRKGESCILCDFVNGYYLNQNECNRDTDGVCKLYAPNSEDGMCLICFDGYFDISGGKCVKVTQELDFCIAYHGEGVCSKCEAGFIVVEGDCERLPQPILNCLVHNAEDTSLCDQCNDNFVLSVHKEICVVNPEIRYCMHFSFLECDKCVEGTVKHENHYFDVFKEYTDNNKIDELNELIYDYLLGSIDKVPHEVCITADIDNCRIYETLTECAECKKGYYVTPSGLCNGYPLDPLGNCLVYEKLDKCLNCSEGFHVAEDGGCTENGKIDFCQGYSGEAEETTCVVCMPTHFLVENECVPRDNDNIEFCQFYSISEDNCQECEEGYVVTSDKLACRVSIHNCAEYSSSDKNVTAHVCNKCIEGSFLNGGGCIEGTVKYCQLYQNNSNNCMRCRSGYYLDGNTCKDRIAIIEFCNLYDAVVEDKCEKCESNAVKMDLENKCKPIQKEENCSTYSTFDTCSGCNDGYQLIDGKCNPIEESEKCLNKTANNCTKCEEGYYLDSGSCIKIPTIITDTCLELEENPTEINACAGCKEGYVPVKTEDSNFCSDAETTDVEEIGYCTKYKKDSSGSKCIKCDAGKTVSLDGKFCLDVCPTGEVAVLGKFTFNDATPDSSVSGESFKKCETVDVSENPQLEHCEIAAMAINRAGNPLTCVKCNSNSIPTQSCPVNLAYFGAEDNDTDDLLLAHVSVECINNPSATFGKDAETTKNVNCLYFKLETVDSNPVFACQSCKFGFTGPIVDLSADVSEVDCTEVVDGCDISVEYNGVLLNSDWMLEIYGFNIPFKFSCHKCNSNDEIPFLNLTFNNKLKGYSLDNDPPCLSANKNGNMVVCRHPNKSGLGMDSSQFDSFPANCALGFYSIDRKKSSNGTVSTSVTCLACKDGYKPLKDFNDYIIIGCEAIDHCNITDKSDGWFNGCHKCDPDHAYDFDPATNLIDYQKCVHTTAQNCLALDSTNNVCAICKKNFTFNKDGICEQLSPENCENFNELSKNTFSKTLEINHIDRAYYFLYDLGCDKCDNGFISVQFDESLDICVESDYVSGNTFPSDENKYITNCSSYYLSPTDELLCHKCMDTFIPTEDKKKCVDGNLFINCKIAVNGGTSCLTCHENFSKTNGACLFKKITNCDIYSDTRSVQTCLTCKEGYRIDQNTCIEGDVKNCKTYNLSPLKCNDCVDGFVLVVDDGLGQQCMPIPNDLNCKNATLKSNNTKLECTECKDGNFPTTDPTEMNENTCINGAVIQECAEYDIKDDLKQSTFQCTKCSKEYYLNEDKNCSLRSYIDGCAETVYNADVCSKCKDNYVFNGEGECERLKIGIPNCKVYADDFECQICDSFSYPKDNLCEYIPSKDRIKNCKRYEFQGQLKCVECNAGTFLKSGECKVTLARDCLIVKNETNCLTCQHGWYLYVDNNTGNVNCFKSNISGCKEYAKDENKCAVCVAHFVVNSVFGCSPVEVEIENCEVYENETENCLECKMLFALSADQTNCTFLNGIEMFHNCKRLRYTNTPRCVTCDPGHFFDDGICSPCHGQTFGKGCLYCDYAANDSCLVCRPGYFMSVSGVCSLNEALKTDFTNDVKSNLIFGVKKWIALIVAFLITK